MDYNLELIEEYANSSGTPAANHQAREVWTGDIHDKYFVLTLHASAPPEFHSDPPLDIDEQHDILRALESNL